MNLSEAMGSLAKKLTDELVVTNISCAARGLYGAKDRDRNLYSIVMGLASSVGLGLALALPQKRVIVLDGDGSLLMNLGSLATIANEEPVNLILMVLDNECYQGAGGQPTATAGKIDLRGVGEQAGIKNSVTVRTLPEMERVLKAALSANELYFVVVKIDKADTWKRLPIQLNRVEGVFRFLRSLKEEGLIDGWSA